VLDLTSTPPDLIPGRTTPGSAGRYVKQPIPVVAVQVLEPFMVRTLEGMMTGQPGDWLVIGEGEGERWPVKASIFARTYTRAPDLSPTGQQDPAADGPRVRR
jgi:hypothetical protein